MENKNSILDFFRANKELLSKRFRVIKIGIFGSYARGEATEQSDIDIIVEFDEDIDSIFDRKYELKEYLMAHFRKKVDLCREGAIKPIFKQLILKDAIYA